jgi:Mrp family chromosome partitioning ATPase
MSRNFELMQKLEWELERPALRINEADPPRSEEPGGEITCDRQWAADELLELVHRIFLLQKEEPPRIAVFAGIDSSSGCSQICASVAGALARNASGLVCLLEANFRTPSLPSLFNTTNHYGFADALLGDGPIRSFTKSVGPEKLRLISAGALGVDSSSLLTTRLVGPRFTELRTGFDFVIVDAPPLTEYADAIALARLSDGIVLVLEAESTRKQAALRAVEKLRSANVPILGAVLNKRVFPIPEAIYSKL